MNSLTVPTHEGYKFSGWEITAGYITSVTDNATVYIKYTEDSGGGTGEQTVQTYVNGDGDICVQISNLQDEISGRAYIALSFSKALDTVSYESFDVFEFGSGAGAKTDANIDSKIISFTDEDCSSHDFYRIGFYDENGNRLGQKLWDEGLYITSIKFVLSDYTEKVYTATK